MIASGRRADRSVPALARGVGSERQPRGEVSVVRDSEVVAAIAGAEGQPLCNRRYPEFSPTASESTASRVDRFRVTVAAQGDRRPRPQVVAHPF